VLGLLPSKSAGVTFNDTTGIADPSVLLPLMTHPSSLVVVVIFLLSGKNRCGYAVDEIYRKNVIDPSGKTADTAVIQL
jgi:hypothetical protein